MLVCSLASIIGDISLRLGWEITSKTSSSKMHKRRTGTWVSKDDTLVSIEEVSYSRLEQESGGPKYAHKSRRVRNNGDLE